jgi:hypothetical protein
MLSSQQGLSSTQFDDDDDNDDDDNDDNNKKNKKKQLLGLQKYQNQFLHITRYNYWLS